MIVIHKSKVSFLMNLDFIFNKVFSDCAKSCSAKIWVCGGAITSLLHDFQPSDYDIFTDNVNDLCTWVQERYGDQEDYFVNDDVINFQYAGKKIQVIKKYQSPSIEETYSRFDFTICSAGYDGENLYCHDMFFVDNAQKIIQIKYWETPISTYRRTYKYVSRGFRMSHESLHSLLHKINELNLLDELEGTHTLYHDGTRRVKWW